MGPNHKRCTSLLDLTASSLVPLLFPLGGGQGSGVRGRPGSQAHVPLVHGRAGVSAGGQGGVLQEEGDEIMLSTLDSDEELDAVYEKFMETLFEDEDE